MTEVNPHDGSIMRIRFYRFSVALLIASGMAPPLLAAPVPAIRLQCVDAARVPGVVDVVLAHGVADAPERLLLRFPGADNDTVVVAPMSRPLTDSLTRYEAPLPATLPSQMPLQVLVYAGAELVGSQTVVLPEAGPAAAAAPPPEVAAAASAGTRVKLEIGQGGLYAVWASQLAACLSDYDETQVTAQIASTNLAVTCMGTNVPWFAATGGTGICFVAEAYEDAFTDRNVYWVEPAQPGLAMAVTNVTALGNVSTGQTVRVTRREEQDLIDFYYVPSETDWDCWFWDYVKAPDATHASHSFAFDLPGLVATGEVQITPWIRNAHIDVSGIDGVVYLSVNGGAETAFPLDGVGPFTPSVTVTGGLAEVGNTLTVRTAASNSLSVLYVIDSISLEYTRSLTAESDLFCLKSPGEESVRVDSFTNPGVEVFDMSSPGIPIRIGSAAVWSTNGFYACRLDLPDPNGDYLFAATARAPALVRGVGPNPWLDPSRACDYLIVAPSGHVSALQSFVDYRSNRFRVQVATIEELGDMFNHGRYTPYIVRELLQASTNWAASPRYVLLAGSGHYDYKANAGLDPSLPNHIAPALVKAPEGTVPAGFAYYGADNPLADLDGDGVPDVAIGRFPARTTAELSRCVAKTIAAERSHGWKHMSTLAADAFDSANDFAGTITQLAATFPVGVSVATAAADDIGTPQVKQAITDSFNGREWFMAYYGHGSLWGWGDGSAYLAAWSLGSLTNALTPPFVMALTCSMNDAFKPTWGPTCLGSDVMRTIDGGAAAVWAPASLSYNDAGAFLGQKLVERMCQPSITAVGGAQLFALRALYENAALAQRHWQTQTIVYLGDPALDMRSGKAPTVMLVR